LRATRDPAVAKRMTSGYRPPLNDRDSSLSEAISGLFDELPTAKKPDLSRSILRDQS
jgi:hypothetical protein